MLGEFFEERSIQLRYRCMVEFSETFGIRFIDLPDGLKLILNTMRTLYHAMVQNQNILMLLYLSLFV